MRKFLLRIAYDGTDFHGWQRQNNLRTVQGELENALTKLLGPEFRLGSSSRTDAGVHALRHPVTVTTEKTIPVWGLLKGVNTLLPADVAATEAHQVDLRFDAKRMALRKIYRYRFFESQIADPFEEKYSWRRRYPMNMPAMQAAARHLVGGHDFTSFRAADCDALHSRRFMQSIVVHREHKVLNVTVVGNAFLRSMVRVIAGTLMEVGRGRQHPDWVREVLQACDRTVAAQTAPGRGLFLVDVIYPPR